jgi:dethiobiotin synthetase
MFPKRFFVTAIGTGCGKTVVSAILTEALKADYWKPIQSGIEEIDRETVQSLVSNSKSVFHHERYVLTRPLSPHASSKIDGIHINLNDFELPDTENHLIVEGAGGVLVPINDEGDMVIDIAEKLSLEIIVVTNLYLGSINHTLLTINELRRRGMKIVGLVFNGKSVPSTEDFILKYTNLPLLFRVEHFVEVDKNKIKQCSEIICFDEFLL